MYFRLSHTHPQVASDPYLQQAQAVQCVERTLAELNARQLAVGNEWDRWNAQHHTEAVLNDIMAANMEVGPLSIQEALSWNHS